MSYKRSVEQIVSRSSRLGLVSKTAPGLSCYRYATISGVNANGSLSNVNGVGLISGGSIRFNSQKNDIGKILSETKDEVNKSINEKAAPTSAEKAQELAKNAESQKQPKQQEKKLTIWEKVKHEANHYWSGTKLLGFEIKVATKLLFKMLLGYELTRRENTQLKRTLSDVLRLVPFSAFVLVPFAELLLPVALKIFPNLLPSTYESNQDKQKKREKLMAIRSKASTFLRNTIQESNNLMKLPKKITEEEKFLFIEFFRKINVIDQRPSNEQIIKVARLFKDDDVLDNLSRPQLVAMAKYMGLTPFGSDSFIRYQIRTKLIAVVQDDRAIRYEGVDALSTTELKLACRSRGLKNVDVSPGRLRDDLNTWLELRLNQKIPSTLLILSSIYTYGQSDVDNYYDALLNVLSSIPDEVYDVAKSELSDDYKMKLNVLKEQQEKIQEENEQEKKMSQKIVEEEQPAENAEKQEQQQLKEQEQQQAEKDLASQKSKSKEVWKDREPVEGEIIKDDKSIEEEVSKDERIVADLAAKSSKPSIEDEAKTDDRSVDAEANKDNDEGLADRTIDREGKRVQEGELSTLEKETTATETLNAEAAKKEAESKK